MQSDGRNLARQGQPRQLGLHSLYQKVFVEEAKGAVTATGGGRRALKTGFSDHGCGSGSARG